MDRDKDPRYEPTKLTKSYVFHKQSVPSFVNNGEKSTPNNDRYALDKQNSVYERFAQFIKLNHLPIVIILFSMVIILLVLLSVCFFRSTNRNDENMTIPDNNQKK